MTLPTLNIALTFDTDNDVFDQTVARENADARGQLQWRGIEEGIPQIRNVLRTHKDCFGNTACATWFVRADGQLRTLMGSAGYLLDTYRELWQQLESEGDELACHPHLYRETDEGWHQETDAERLREGVAESLRAFRDRGWDPEVSRIGEAFCCNALMEELGELGFHADSTAMPGRVRKDDERSLDWENTPQHPYHPSRADYRVPGDDALRLLEIPMSMAHVRADYDERPFSRYVDLSFHPRALREGLRELLPRTSLLVTITHPSAVLTGLNPKPHGLLSFDWAAFETNLHTIIDTCSASNRPFRFQTMSQVLSSQRR